MRTVIQRVSSASVRVPEEAYEASIDKGLLVLAAFMLVAAGISYVNNVDSAYSPLVMSSLITLLMGCFPMIFVPST
mgnify:FL=1